MKSKTTGSNSPTAKNKISTSNPKNQTYNNYVAKSLTIKEKAANEMFKDKTFADEYSAVFMLSNVLKVTFGFGSLCTVFVAIYWALSPLVGTYLSTLIALSICIIQEILKNSVWSKLSKHHLKYKEFSKVLAISAIGFNLFSVLGSVFGAYQLPSMTASVSHPLPTLTNIDSINLAFLGQITPIDQSIQAKDNEVKNTTSNSTKRLASKNQSLLIDQKNALLKAQSLAIEEAKERNNQELQNHKKHVIELEQKRAVQMDISRINCIGIALVFELGLILCSLFCAYYLFRLYIDTNEEDQTEPTDTQAKNDVKQGDISVQDTKGHQAPNVTNNVRKIGFKNDTQEHDKQDNDVKRPTNNDVKCQELEYTVICELEECKTPFIHNHGAQRFCSAKCRKKAHSNRTNNNN